MELGNKKEEHICLIRAAIGPLLEESKVGLVTYGTSSNGHHFNLNGATDDLTVAFEDFTAASILVLSDRQWRPVSPKSALEKLAECIDE